MTCIRRTGEGVPRCCGPTTGAAGSTTRRRTHDGSEPEAVIAEMLATPGVERIHSRNIAWGCYMFAVTR